MRVKRGARAVETEGLRTIERAQRAGPPREEYDELQAALERAFTWRQLARAVHRRGGVTPERIRSFARFARAPR